MTAQKYEKTTKASPKTKAHKQKKKKGQGEST